MHVPWVPLEMTATKFFGTFFFFLALLHTFSVFQIQKWVQKYKWLHFLGEVEMVFFFYAILYLFTSTALNGPEKSWAFLQQCSFSEALFVFVIMCVAATRPIVYFCEKILFLFAHKKKYFYIALMVLGPLSGSFITEPAAMSITAMILSSVMYSRFEMTRKFEYATLGLLFVSVSLGGTLTNFAAPPVLMVASKWEYTTPFMFKNFGYKSIVSIITSTLLYVWYFRDELKGTLHWNKIGEKKVPYLIILAHFFILSVIVSFSHSPVIFFLAFLFFLGLYLQTLPYQNPLKIKESMGVMLFLSGLVILGGSQTWWLKPLLEGAGDQLLYLGSTVLTSITDNAALTYLASLLNLSESAKYFVLAGSVIGGGLTLIANAPNLSGFELLKNSFERDNRKFSSMSLFLAAILPTLIALIFFAILP